jgi:hypothetical protein
MTKCVSFDNISKAKVMIYNFKNKREESKTKENYFLMSIAKVFISTLYLAK